ncbi:MAG: hypothetical protein ACOX8P_05385 [Tepidanaerobacteraceae bacterium]
MNLCSNATPHPPAKDKSYLRLGTSRVLDVLRHAGKWVGQPFVNVAIEA